MSLVKHTNPITYSLEDLRGEPVQGSFYEQELQATDQQIFCIERVLRRQGQRAYVKWRGTTLPIRGYLCKRYEH